MLFGLDHPRDNRALCPWQLMSQDVFSAADAVPRNTLCFHRDGDPPRTPCFHRDGDSPRASLYHGVASVGCCEAAAADMKGSDHASS